MTILYLLVEPPSQRSVVALARAMRLSRSLQHVDMRRNTVHREGACALLDALDKVIEKRECNVSSARKANTDPIERTARRGHVPLSALPKNSRRVRNGVRKTLPPSRQRHRTQESSGKGTGTRAHTKDARESSLLTFNDIAVTHLASRSARGGRAPLKRIWSAVGITTSTARVRMRARSAFGH